MPNEIPTAFTTQAFTTTSLLFFRLFIQIIMLTILYFLHCCSSLYYILTSFGLSIELQNNSDERWCRWEDKELSGQVMWRIIVKVSVDFFLTVSPKLYFGEPIIDSHESRLCVYCNILCGVYLLFWKYSKLEHCLYLKNNRCFLDKKAFYIFSL